MNKVPDNYYETFPSRMSDGRTFTDYRTNCITNNGISQNMTSWEYRYYLQNNASEIVNKERADRDSILAYSGPNAPEVPVKNIQNCNKGFCTIENFNENGLGLGKATNETF
tara:strand:- start:2409 stop:2741 length:333 start_codon:yes stop_codon:yes gene_type:complete